MPPQNLSLPMPSPEDDRPGWLNWRRAGVCSTDTASLFDRSPFATIIDTYNSKVSGFALPDEDKLIMRRGRIMEPIVCDEFQHFTGCKLRRQPAKPSTDFDWMRTTIDRQMLTGHGSITMPDGSLFKPDRPGVFEAKTTTEIFMRKLIAEGPPEGWIIQATHSMICWGYDYCVIAVLAPQSWTFRYWVIELNADLAAQIIDTTRAFWNGNVLAKVPPTVTVNAKVPEIKGDYANKEGEKDWIDLTIKKGEADRLLSQAKDYREIVNDEVRAYIEGTGFDVVQGNGVRIFNRQTKPRAVLNAKQVQAEAGTIFARIMEAYDSGEPNEPFMMELAKTITETFNNPEWCKSHLYKIGEPSRPLRFYYLNERQNNE